MSEATLALTMVPQATSNARSAAALARHADAHLFLHRLEVDHRRVDRDTDGHHQADHAREGHRGAEEGHDRRRAPTRRR